MLWIILWITYSNLDIVGLFEYYYKEKNQRNYADFYSLNMFLYCSIINSSRITAYVCRVRNAIIIKRMKK